MLNAKLKPIETDEERSAARYRLLLPASAETADAALTDVVIRDLSARGFLIESSAPLGVGDEVTLEIPGAGTAVGDIVWGSGGFSGGEFRKPLSGDDLAAARSSSAVVWPEFVARSAADRSAEAFEPIRDEVAEPQDEERLPVARRLQIIFGASLLLWMPIFFGVWAISR